MPGEKVTEYGGTMHVHPDESVRRDLDELTREVVDFGRELCRRI